HRPISICFVGKKLFLIFNKMFTISPWDMTLTNAGSCLLLQRIDNIVKGVVWRGCYIFRGTTQHPDNNIDTR
uniref:hypothetical protein n=1 Tax=Aeromonas salmonicida TaxID=645 RepID=UPI00195518BD